MLSTHSKRKCPAEPGDEPALGSGVGSGEGSGVPHPTPLHHVHLPKTTLQDGCFCDVLAQAGVVSLGVAVSGAILSGKPLPSSRHSQMRVFRLSVPFPGLRIDYSSPTHSSLFYFLKETISFRWLNFEELSRPLTLFSVSGFLTPAGQRAGNAPG